MSGEENIQLVREIGAVKAELAGLTAEVAGTNQRLDDIVITQLKDHGKRLDDAILTQLRDHGKRIRELEDHISTMAETCARERGQQAGSRATLVFIMTVISSLGGCIGAAVGRLF